MHDRDILANFLRTRDEQVFALLVHRYLPLVYSAARRQLADPAAAEDVAQAVFILLARKAPALLNSSAHASLSGWLLKATHFCVRDTRRLAQRRTHHEQKASTMRPESTTPPDPDGTQLSPHLDAALIKLSPTDRSAIALKYLEGRTLEDVGLALNLSKDAAHKRISRALQKLRTLLARENPALSAALPAILASASRPIPIPPHLFASIPAAALHTSAATAASTLIAKGAAHMMSALKLKLALAALLLTAALGSTVLITAQAQTAARPAISAEDPPAGTPAPSFPAAPVNTATLASGVSLQLIAIADPADHSTTFWNPDGTPMDPPADFAKLGRVRVQSDPDQIGAKFALQITAPRDLDIDTQIDLNGTGGAAQSGNDDGNVRNYLLVSTFPKDKTSTTLRINIASGPWSSAIESDGRNPEAVGDSKTGDYTLSPALQDDGQLTFVLSEINLITMARRFTIIDADGQLSHPSSYSRSAASHLQMSTFKFRKLTKDQIKSARYEIRPYDQWIEFRNVSLLPGTLTKPQIATSDSEKPK